MAMKRAMQAMKAMKVVKKPSRAPQQKKTEIKATTPTASPAKKVDDEEDTTFVKKWDAVYIEKIKGKAFTWKLISIFHNKKSGQVEETWCWGES